MRHLDDGVLRRMADEPLSIPDGKRRHYQSCLRCRERYEIVAADAAAVRAAFSLAPVGVNVESALARFHAQVPAQARRVEWRLGGWNPWGAARGWTNPALRRWVGATGAALAISSAFLWTPAGSLAEQFIQIFQPKEIVAVSVTGEDLQTLQQLSTYGTVSGPARVADRTLPTLAAAQGAAGFHVLAPGALPADITAQPRYHLVPSTTASFTFSARKAAEAAEAAGKRAPAMPRTIDGSSIVVTTGMAVATTYADHTSGVPQLVVGEMRAPLVRSTGVSLAELESYLLAQPGISPRLAAQIRAIGDPASTLPIPILIDRETAQHVTVQGVQGLAIGDSTGIGSGVVWQKGGMIYGVAGPQSLDEVVNIANALR